MQQANEVKRSQRVSERVREELAKLLSSMRDPRLEGAVLTRVEMTDDLRHARVYVRSLQATDERARRTMIKGFEAASPRLRRDVTRAVKLRYSPDLRFFFDEGLDAENRVEEILHEIHDEKKRLTEG